MPNHSITTIPPAETYSKIEGIEPSNTPITTKRLDGKEIVMYGDSPLEEILPTHVKVRIVEADGDTANPDGIVSLTRATIEEGKGGRLVIAHEIGHAISAGRRYYDLTLFRQLANISNKNLNPGRRIAIMANISRMRLLNELTAWNAGAPYAKVFGISEEDWAKAKNYGVAGYSYPLLLDLIDFTYSFEGLSLRNFEDLEIQLFSHETGEVSKVSLKQIFDDKNFLKDQRTQWDIARNGLQQVIESQNQ